MKITTITATWNCASTVVDCLDSFANQSYDNREHIVIDGASTDGTLELLQLHRDRLAALVSEKDLGIYDALNKGLQRASGDIVGFLHADDLYANSDVLTHISAAFKADSSVCAVYGDLQYVHRKNTNVVVRNWKSSPFSSRQLSWGWMPPHPTLYVKREWYERIGGFDTRYSISADYFSTLQLFSNSAFKAVYLPEVLVKMRLGGISNRSIKSMVIKTCEDWHALKRMNLGALSGVGAIFWKNFSKLTQFKY